MKLIDNEIKLSDGYTLCCKKYDAGDGSYEFTIYIEDKESMITQDICLVRPHRTENGKVDDKSVDCFVWDDQNDECFTHRFIIPVWEDNETQI